MNLVGKYKENVGWEECITKNSQIPEGFRLFLERTTRLELATNCLEGSDSSQLSYIRIISG